MKNINVLLCVAKYPERKSEKKWAFWQEMSAPRNNFYSSRLRYFKSFQEAMKLVKFWKMRYEKKGYNVQFSKLTPSLKK